MLNDSEFDRLGNEAFALAEELWPLPRSLTGDGFIKSLDLIEDYMEVEINRISLESGTEVFDWKIPDQWEVEEAYLIDPLGMKICDFKENNLHLVSYSVPFQGTLSKNELLDHVHSLPENPSAIPYVTAYYVDYWGFCMTHESKLSLVEGEYKVVVKTKRFPGQMILGEVVMPGNHCHSEVLLSTYLCHPSMANNELSGPVVTASLVKYFSKKRANRGIRALFIPETIGSISYLALNLESLKRNIVAGYVLTCIGDEGLFSLLPSKSGNSLSDRVAREILGLRSHGYKEYSWLSRGSDERQYGSPGIDLPIASLMKTKYGEFPEYHTSLDTLGTVVTAKGLTQSIKTCIEVVEALANTFLPAATNLCEPNLGKRSLYSTVSSGKVIQSSRNLLNVLTFSDGTNRLKDIKVLTGMDDETIETCINVLSQYGLVKDR